MVEKKKELSVRHPRMSRSRRRLPAALDWTLRPWQARSRCCGNLEKGTRRMHRQALSGRRSTPSQHDVEELRRS